MFIDDKTLLSLIAERNAPRAGASGQGTSVPRPDKELADQTLDPKVRAELFSHYVAKVTDSPSHMWSEAERADINAEIQNVLKASGIRS
jgi:hypothetical protein